ncbi:unnamed protein product [Prorocentrum cordatum]|uniref:RanBP2-type domain-containing protein n=1 Tax=Prorocentrum cordatum TaxID=2364126 RepID=A0ABN9V5K2_9DINO|nr:unnamed protein product [Polarella glacialis]
MPAWSTHGRAGGPCAGQWHSPSRSSGNSTEWKQDPSGKWHWIGTMPSAQSHSEKRLWACRGCSSTNHTKTACGTCGMKRTYSDVVSLTARPPNPETGKPVSNNPVGGGPYHNHTNGDYATAYLTIVTDFGYQAAELEGRLAEKRAELQALRLIGQRLDGTRAALERSRKRRGQAEQAMALAQSTLTAAVEEEKSLAAQLAELEAAVGSDATPAEASLVTLGEQLAAAVEQARSFENVGPAVGDEAQHESEALLARFQATLQAAEAAMHAAKTAVPRRLNGKQPIEHPPEAPEVRAPDRRLPKKQKVQSHLEHWFGPLKPCGSLTAAATAQPPASLATSAARPCHLGATPPQLGALVLADAAVVTLKVVTADAQTLHPQQGGCSYYRTSLALMNGKAQILEQQFRQRGFSAVGLQEDRARQAGKRKGVYFTMFVSPATSDGALGVQFWLDRELGHHVAQWRARSPRVLFGVNVSREGAVHVWFSARAPASCTGADERLEFWTDLTSVAVNLRARFPNAFWFVAVDANARVGRAPSEAFGTACPERENENGAALRIFAETLQLVALNTFSGAEPTWHHNANTSHRIDYVLIRNAHQTWASDVHVRADMDLTFNGRRDHSAVSAVCAVQQSALGSAPRPPPPVRIDKAGAGNAKLVEAFQTRLLEAPIPDEPRVDEQLARVNSIATEAALDVFGQARPLPRKPWLSQTTWDMVQLIAPLRRCAHHAGRHRFARFQRACFDAWLAALPGWRLRRAQHSAASPMSSFTFFALGAAVDSLNAHARAREHESSFYAAILGLQKCVRTSLRADRMEFLDSMVMKAQAAADAGDVRTQFAVARALGARSAVANTEVFQLDGTLTQNASEEIARWEEHFCDVFTGELTTLHEMRRPAQPAHCDPRLLDAGPAATAAAFRKLGRNQGVGIDGVPAEILVAGGGPAATLYASVNERVLQNYQWPLQWCGGLLPHLHKQKGDRRLCDNHRGILLADHAGKGLAGIVKDALGPTVNEHLPATQFGAVAKRGTDFATHMVLTATALAQAWHASLFLLFVDLTKAFDRVIRQLVMGWGGVDSEHRERHLRQLGVAPRAARRLHV